MDILKTYGNENNTQTRDRRKQERVLFGKDSATVVEARPCRRHDKTNNHHESKNGKLINMGM
jgi:hypothetical protein